MPSSHWAQPRRRHSLALLLVATIATIGFAAATADASKIVYGCGADLCVADPDAGAAAQITTDGASIAYQFPSISRDGNWIAAARGDAVVVGSYGANLTAPWAGTRDMNDVAISPDGSAVGESHSYVENVYGCPLTGGCLELVNRSATFYSRGGEPAESTRDYRGGGGVGFLGSAALLSSYYTLSTDSNTICVVADPAAVEAPCEARVTSTATLSSPTGSPDGTLIAAAVGAPPPSTATSVNLYSAATGAAVRKLADNAGSPAFSPDGKEVAYGGADGWIYVVPTAGGTPRRLVQGLSPTWGGGVALRGGSSSGPALASKSLRYRKGRIAVKVRCEGSSTCRGTVRIQKGKVKLGARAYRVAAGKSGKVSVKPSKRGKRIIASASEQKVTVLLAPKAGKTVSKKLTLRR